MGAKKIGMLIAIALLAMTALAGSAQAAEPVSGQVNSTVAEGQIVTLYLDINPADYVTVAVTDNPYPDVDDYYYFDDIEPMLLRNGYSFGDYFNVTVEMRCSGVERDINQVVGSSYTNTLRNTTPSTAKWTGRYDGYTEIAPLMKLEPCAAEEETFSKDLYEGWNLVSLPLTPSDNSASSVLASVWDNVSAVYRYNATSKQFESASTMDPGTGYFVYVTQNCTWTYSGTPCTSMSTELKQGLNMVGWLNCSKDISDALSSIEGNYWYVARWNAVSQSFEVYNPVAPSSFNDFTAMDRGTGYFISAKAGTTLSASC